MEQKNNILKRFYFVRHGQTEDNIHNIYQSADDVLTENGRNQAMLVAEHFVSLPIGIIIASDYERAFQTAEAISGKKGISVHKTELFREIRRPSDLIGKEKQLPEPKRIMDEIIENEPIRNWHHLDEENLFEAVARARLALDYLCNLPEENIIVVTHEMFTKILLMAMATPEDIKAVECYRIMRYFMIGDNTGITIVEYDNFINDNHFHLRIWNDHTHL